MLGHLPMLYRGLPEALAEARKLGPIFWIHVGFGTWALICTGRDAIEILRNRAFTSEHLQEIAPLVAGESLLSHDGQAHKHMRSAMNGPFLPKGIASAGAGQVAAQLLSDLTRGWASAKRARVLPEVQTATLAILFRMLGVRIDDIEPWRRSYRDLLLANISIPLRFPGSPAVRSERARAWIDEQLRALIAEAKKEATSEGLIGALVRQNDDDGLPLTEKELVDNLRLLILGGHETISSTLSWILLHLAAEPELWDRLCAEASEHDAVPASLNEAREFPFAEALFREAVRTHPPFGTMTRRSVAPFLLYERPLPLGALIGVDLWGIAHDESLFPDPHAFRPDRWLGRSGPPTALEISQFGAGPHFCLGYHLAWLEAVQLAVALGQEVGRRKLRPVLRSKADLSPIYVPTEHPARGVVVDFR